MCAYDIKLVPYLLSYNIIVISIIPPSFRSICLGNSSVQYHIDRWACSPALVFKIFYVLKLQYNPLSVSGKEKLHICNVCCIIEILNLWIWLQRIQLCISTTLSLAYRWYLGPLTFQAKEKYHFKEKKLRTVDDDDFSLEIFHSVRIA